MYSTATINMEGADYLYVSAFPDEADNTVSLTVSTIGHTLNIYSMSPAHLAKLADVVNRAIATKSTASTLDMEAVSA